MKKLCQLIALLVCTGCSSAPEAGNLVDITLRDRNTGEILKLYRHQGKLYVAGRPGNRYAVALQNKTGGRTLTVLSVDGINVVTGETAALQQSGYVLDAYTDAEITGWRKSLSEVAAFVFTALPNSYAARTGRPDNVGVIGVAVFRERAPEPPLAMEPMRKSEQAAETAGSTADRAKPAPTQAAPTEERLGTGHGQRETSPVAYTEFRRATERPDEMIQIYYDSYANLVARGVIAAQPAKFPNPFPGQFVPDPSG